MIFNDVTTQETVSVLPVNEQTSDKARERSARHHVRDEHPSNVGTSVGKNPKFSSGQNRSRKSSSPLSGSRSSFLLSEHQSQLHRRNNRPPETRSRRGKENVPPLLCQPGKTYNAKSRRPVLADVTNASHGGSGPLDDVSFAGSTSIQSPSQKVGNAEPGSAGLRFELHHNSFLSSSDSQETITQDSFVPVIKAADHPTESCPESTYASPNTPLREALASFNVMFSSTFTPPANSSITTNDPPNTFRLSFSLPAPPLPAGISISNAFNVSTLASSISQLTGDIAASIAARYEDDYLYQGQYHEDAVVRDETFHWEEEMRCLEVQCGLYGETK